VTLVFIRSLAAAVLAATPLYASPPEAYGGQIELRVALALKAPEASLSSARKLRITSAKSGRLLKTGPVWDVTVRPHRMGIKINDLLFPVTSVRITSLDSVVSLNGKKYRGYFVLLSDGGGLLSVINHVGLEDYLKGVVPSEMPKDWPLEALKAQAVAARTYALYTRSQTEQEDYDLLSDINDQLYRGMERENERTDLAVRQTAGMLLTYENRLAQTLYHSTSGGRTENAEAVFNGGKIPYLKSVRCEFDRESPYYVWQHSMRFSELQSALSRYGIRTGRINGVSLRSRTRTSRIKELNIHTRKGRIIIDAKELRKAVGTKQIKSTRFTLRRRGERITFKGIGYGHGVGLCQFGAKGMAEKNYDFRKILQYYYRGTTISSNLLVKAE
jgi:stage II sporulation protein D